MNTLIITDLARHEHLDRPTMSAVRGGWKVAAPSWSFGDTTYAGRYDSSINAVQSLGQMQNVLTATANDSAFVAGVDVQNKVSQNGANTITRR